MTDRWRELWEIAAGDPEGPATIIVSSDPTEVELRWSDGTVSGLYFYYGAWRFAEGGPAATGDCRVA